MGENPAAIDPRPNLISIQHYALVAIGHYRHQSRSGPAIVIGRKRFSLTAVAVLIEKELVRGRTPILAPILGGELAIKRLQGGLS